MQHAGVVFGFPLLTSVAMRYVEAVHASVIVGDRVAQDPDRPSPGQSAQA